MTNGRRRFPEWLKKRLPSDGTSAHTESVLGDLRLATVCQSAKCPNKGECFSRHIATFMILGDVCTRDCRFCGVASGRPMETESDEPQRVAKAAAEFGLRHVVVTSVTRDDLDDGGAGQFAATVQAIRGTLPKATVEVLVPDFRGDEDAVRAVVESAPDIFNHNVETVPRLYPRVRPQADYRRSLRVLEFAKEVSPSIVTKSGLMVGLGEERDELIGVLTDLRGSGCGMLTMGQYLQPSRENLAVEEFVPPKVFREYEEIALSMGFRTAYCGPFVRSSYNAHEFVRKRPK